MKGEKEGISWLRDSQDVLHIFHREAEELLQ
jgi:hypothetical protein